MNNRKAGVLVSGRGSNLQAVLDRIADGYLPLEISVVISDKADAYALERAANVGIKTVVVARKECASKEEFEEKIDVTPESLIGAGIDGYRLESVLGCGSYGVVYLARHLMMDRLFAFNFLFFIHIYPPIFPFLFLQLLGAEPQDQEEQKE